MIKRNENKTIIIIINNNDDDVIIANGIISLKMNRNDRTGYCLSEDY